MAVLQVATGRRAEAPRRSQLTSASSSPPPHSLNPGRGEASSEDVGHPGVVAIEPFKERRDVPWAVRRCRDVRVDHVDGRGGSIQPLPKNEPVAEPDLIVSDADSAMLRRFHDARVAE